MQIIKSFTKLMFFICPVFATAQSTYLPQDPKDAHFLERIEIKQQNNNILNFSSVRPYNRRDIVNELQAMDSLSGGYTDSTLGIYNYREEENDVELNSIDQQHLHSFFMNNSEWVKNGPESESFLSERPWGSVYHYKANFLEVHTKDFFLAVNPVIQFQEGYETGNKQTVFLNSRGITARGLIANKIGFSTFLTDNQERGPEYFQRNIDSNKAVPGVGFYKAFKKNGVDYFDARGYFTFGITKYINVQFGYDKNFIGNGYRSLFLSDYGNSNLFLKLNTKIWKFNYQNLFMELMPQFGVVNDKLVDRKYAAMHHLSMNVTKALNIGIFEGIIFDRRNRFDFQYMNPIIFLRHVEGTVGSSDNALAGLDFKANVIHRLQFYGQLILDEFKLSEMIHNRTSWINKFGYQLGVKYIDAFGVPNLDLQFESNRVRPYTYSHDDSTANYTHYNQPLAHPLGANFQEFIGIINYQPITKLYLNLKTIFYTKGLDSAGVNFGGNPFEKYTTRPRDNGFTIGSGNKATCVNTILQASYELKQNLFIDISAQYRSFKTKDIPSSSSSTILSAGVRLNMFRRNYDL
jgi:hypothetical protein